MLNSTTEYTTTKCLRTEYEREVFAIESMSGDSTGWTRHVAQAKENLAVREEVSSGSYVGVDIRLI